MALVKCPRCELNYILDGGTLCTVCRREVKGEHEIIDTPEMCSVCGENPAVAGSDLCMSCLKEMNRRIPSSSMDDTMVPETSIGIDSVSTMDEIELDIVDDAMASEFGAEDEFKDSDEDEEEEEEQGVESDILSTDALADDEAAEDEDDSMDDDDE